MTASALALFSTRVARAVPRGLLALCFVTLVSACTLRTRVTPEAIRLMLPPEQLIGLPPDSAHSLLRKLAWPKGTTILCAPRPATPTFDGCVVLDAAVGIPYSSDIQLSFDLDSRSGKIVRVRIEWIARNPL